MLNKLAISGMKHRIRDYSVLFSGLTIAAAIFYMFMSLATNQSFLKNNSPASATPLIFGFGIVLLAIITLVYVIYANGFLMSMRQKEYGMFMMLGARSKKIGSMIFVETLAIGILATIIGVIVGIGFTGILSKVLINSMGMKISHFDSFYFPALLYTLVFFVVIFAIAAIKNSRNLMKTDILKLLKKDSQPTKVQKTGVKKVIQAIFGLIFLAIGYYSMTLVTKQPELIFAVIFVALVTIVLGTYLVVNALFSWIIKILKSNKRFSMKKLNNFTLSQLSFRISDYTKILSMVAMLFALALGAITVGVEFKNSITNITDSSGYYDLVVHNIDKTQRKNVNKLAIDEQVTYQYKINDKSIYLDKDQFKNHKLNSYKMTTDTNEQRKLINYDFSTEKQQQKFDQTELASMLPMEDYGQRVPQFVDRSQFNNLKVTAKKITFIKVKDFSRDIPMIKKIAKLDEKRSKNPIIQKYDTYEFANGFFSGLEFMGLFLGLAFLAMLASCLMFKILSGAASDVKRYEMLHKIGVRSNLLTKSINREIAVLFLIPGILGVIHVLFGLQMFKSEILIPNPYAGIYIPFIGFAIIYGLYYVLTITIYKKIVLKK